MVIACVENDGVTRPESDGVPRERNGVIVKHLYGTKDISPIAQSDLTELLVTRFGGEYKRDHLHPLVFFEKKNEKQAMTTKQTNFISNLILINYKLFSTGRSILLQLADQITLEETKKKKK